MAKENPRQNECGRISCVGQPSVGPSSACEQQSGERGHCAEAYAAECRAETRYPYGTNHLGKRKASVGHRSNSGKGRNEQQCAQRSHHRSKRDCRKAVAGVKRGAGRRADREGRKHRRPDPGDDLARAPGIGECQSPTHCSRDDEALCPAEQASPQQEHCDRGQRSAAKKQREEIEKPRGAGRH